jgi:phage tail-like protein
MPIAADLQLGLSMRFSVQIEGHDLKYWAKASGLEVSWDVCEYRSGDAGNERWYFPGVTKYPTVKLERAAQKEDTDAVKKWLEETSFNHSPQTGSVQLLDAKLVEVHTWNLRHVIPVKWSINAFEAGSSKVAVESLELAHMGFLEDE